MKQSRRESRKSRPDKTQGSVRFQDKDDVEEIDEDMDFSFDGSDIDPDDEEKRQSQGWEEMEKQRGYD